MSKLIYLKRANNDLVCNCKCDDGRMEEEVLASTEYWRSHKLKRKR